MRENNRKSIARIGKLPQFTTMNVIDGQAVQGLYASLIFYSLTIDNILNIIVLLILAGVALATLTGNSSIVENANKTVGQYNQKAGEEQNLLGAIEDKMAEYGLMQPLTGTAEVDANGLATKRTLIKPNAYSDLQIVIPVGFAPAVLAGGNNPGQDGSVASIMLADQWKNITTEQINKGIVIVDHAITYDNGQTTGTVPDFSEYVWVPITGSGSNTFARTAWNGPYWANGVYYNSEHPLAEALTSNYFWEDKTTTEYTNMVTSVSRNKGFYISRYEASKDSTARIAQSKRGQATWTDIAQNNTTGIGAIQASANNTTANTHLMYGIEWDSTLNWLIGNATISSSTAGQTKTMELSDVQTNSCSWGNYNNSTGDAAKQPYVQDTKQNTGASEYWKANNIYDLAGNVREWTQEKYSTGSVRANRGGFYNNNGDGSPAAYRDDLYESNTSSFIRFPFQLLLVALTSASEAQCK